MAAGAGRFWLMLRIKGLLLDLGGGGIREAMLFASMAFSMKWAEFAGLQLCLFKKFVKGVVIQIPQE
ncbi:hypothetical protein DWQ65_09590 [Treponema phagedenis]|uniref:Uncharacterized protein n=2 Tax=Treponema phagedenis TaxID=162 RepID=A0A0B7GXX6_TREPH|nr:hypothetical protein HMPREF9554_00094 [Treponema phagedenis F0421]QSH96078.1 hypothetical protein C5O78_13840 [Treponema phagedenis]QSI00305.1 hypothetical protein DWQ65_09590 [Treponema phagedenis]CEM63368.1 conserved hypothetical protein [Treponema phagedenis]